VIKLEKIDTLYEVDKATGCWLWHGPQNGCGYGQVYLGQHKYAYAHRFFFERYRGPVGEKTLDHLCRVRNCVNPAHLEPVSGRENTLRGVGLSAQFARRDKCDKCGGEFSERKVHGVVRGRFCKNCKKLSMRNSRARAAEILKSDFGIEP
jgi:hypothetical protein